MTVTAYAVPFDPPQPTQSTPKSTASAAKPLTRAQRRRRTAHPAAARKETRGESKQRAQDAERVNRCPGPHWRGWITGRGESDAKRSDNERPRGEVTCPVERDRARIHDAGGVGLVGGASEVHGLAAPADVAERNIECGVLVRQMTISPGSMVRGGFLSINTWTV